MAFAMATFFTGCSSAPTNEFLNLPLHVIYSNNGAEGSFGDKVSVINFVNYGFIPDVKKSWKKIDENTWSLLVNAKDKLTGQETELNIVLVKLSNPDRVIFHRLLINGKEANGYEKDTIANQLAFGAAEKTKN